MNQGFVSIGKVPNSETLLNSFYPHVQKSFASYGRFEVFRVVGCFETKGGLQGINGFLAETKN
jgi:hypothetical protein